MIILAVAVVITLSSSGIIGKASEATFKQNIKTFMEEYERYKVVFVGLEGGKLSDLNVTGETIDKTITSIPNNLEYKNNLEIQQGTFIYIPNISDKQDTQRAKWACEVGMKVQGISNCSDIKHIETPITSYKKVGGIYYNTPDLTGFNPNNTFYVTYDENGTETIGDSILNKEPSNWYDYENKKWANIVTINGNVRAYFVWLPRYAYKVDKIGKLVDVKFVAINNSYKDTSGSNAIYSDKTPVFDAEGNQTNYVISSAYTLDMTDEGKQNVELPGFWMSKYEISKSEMSEFTTIRTTNSIKVNKITYVGLTTFDYYINGELKNSSTNATYTFSNLLPDTKYTIKIIGRDSYGIKMSELEQQITTLGENTNGITGFTADTYGKKIQIYKTILNEEATQSSTKTYEYYLNDSLITSNNTGNYIFEGLQDNTVYKVTIKIKDSSNYFGTYTRTFTTPGTPTYNKENAPDITGFNKNTTYYVTYDDEGNETRTLMEGNEAPTNWYDYENKKWANIVAVDKTTGAEAYFVWLPRYEYRVVGIESDVASDKRIDISFIPVSKVVQTTGYIIGSVFTVDMTDDGGSIKHLPGFWMAKYEISKIVT